MSKKILVIEDDNILQKTIKIALESAGYLVVQAFNGEEGYDKIQKEEPDLILLDLVMAVKPGEWVLEQLNANGMIDRCPLLVLTVNRDTARMNNCLENLNVKNYLNKADYSLEDLIITIKQML